MQMNPTDMEAACLCYTVEYRNGFDGTKNGMDSDSRFVTMQFFSHIYTKPSLIKSFLFYSSWFSSAGRAKEINDSAQLCSATRDFAFPAGDDSSRGKMRIRGGRERYPLIPPDVESSTLQPPVNSSNIISFLDDEQVPLILQLLLLLLFITLIFVTIDTYIHIVNSHTNTEFVSVFFFFFFSL